MLTVQGFQLAAERGYLRALGSSNGKCIKTGSGGNTGGGGESFALQIGRPGLTHLGESFVWSIKPA